MASNKEVAKRFFTKTEPGLSAYKMSTHRYENSAEPNVEFRFLVSYSTPVLMYIPKYNVLFKTTRQYSGYTSSHVYEAEHFAPTNITSIDVPPDFFDAFVSDCKYGHSGLKTWVYKILTPSAIRNYMAKHARVQDLAYYDSRNEVRYCHIEVMLRYLRDMVPTAKRMGVTVDEAGLEEVKARIELYKTLLEDSGTWNHVRKLMKHKQKEELNSVFDWKA